MTENIAFVDGYVFIYESRQYQLKSQLKRTKGCQAFAIRRGIEISVEELSETSHPHRPPISRASSSIGSNTEDAPPSSPISADMQPTARALNIEKMGVPQQVIKVACAARKRVIIYRWIDGEYVDCRQISVPDRIRSLAWINSAQLCCVSQRDYYLVNINTEEVSSLFALDGASPQIRLLTISQRNMVTRLPNADEVLVANDSQCFVSQQRYILIVDFE